MEPFRARSAEVDLVIMDMVMPVMGGREAFQHMAELDPGVPVILSSGFSKPEDVKAMMGSGLRGFVRKPCRMAELSRIVADNLGRAANPQP